MHVIILNLKKRGCIEKVSSGAIDATDAADTADTADNVVTDFNRGNEGEKTGLILCLN